MSLLLQVTLFLPIQGSSSSVSDTGTIHAKPIATNMSAINTNKTNAIVSHRARGGVTWRGHVAASVRWGHTRRRPRLTPCVRQPLTACVRPGLMLSATASLPRHWQRCAVRSWPKCSHQAQHIRSSINGFDADSSQMFKAHVTIAASMAGSCYPASNQRNRWLPS